ncbi:LuxR C-terminal-related transcriptional regulator [Actinoplanes sp. NBC_00393]|uniref:ATP-binding protein n=1 Tax=Actinoplanes sp. NBC_00393 TaxID=2975953 RepID=UPI002E208B70
MSPHGNLPAELSSFVDRTRERAELKRLLAAARLVTVTGIGGVGKTRTALRVAAEVRRAFPDGAWLADLATLTDPGLLTETVAQAVGVKDQTARPPAESLAGYLAPRRLLLILDTCEHLAADCAGLAQKLLQAAPGLRVLATSRQPLGATGEHVLALPPLPTADACTLFTERATAASAAFTDADQSAVARLCERLDGIPLGIELAAVRTRALPVGQIADLVETGRTRLLTPVRAAIDGSHDLCTPAERLLWARAAVFPGTFTLDAAQQVCTDDQLPADDIIDVITGLVDKSILHRDDDPDPRYRLLDTLREYGLERLRDTGAETDLRRRHRDHHLHLARRFDAEWCGPGQADWYRRLTREHANLRAALDFSLTDPAEHQAGLELAGALLYYWMACGHPREGRYYLDRLLTLDSPPGPALTRALWVCAWISALQGDMDAAENRLAQCRPHAETQNDTAAAGWIAYIGSAIAVFSGDPQRAMTLAEQSAHLHTHGGDPNTGLLVAYAAQAIALAFLNELDRAIAVTDEYRKLCADHHEQWACTYADWAAGVAELGRGNPTAAVDHARAALRFKRQLGDHGGCAMVVDVLATGASMQGDAARAARLIGLAHRLWETVGLPQLGSPDLSASRVWTEKQARHILGDQRFDDALTTGLTDDFDTGIAYALDEPGPRPATNHPPDPAPLTTRERQVAELVADGLTNQQIADRLMISRRTANTHIEHILTKLDFTARTQIAAWIAART